MFCFGGNPRPSPTGSRPDIGACENLLATPLVGVEHESRKPTQFVLHQNYPNPFNPTTKIQFTIVNPRLNHEAQPGGQGQLTIVKVYDVFGREVSTLVNEVKEPGTYTVQFDASGLASGVYFYRLTASDFVQTKKLLLLRCGGLVGSSFGGRETYDLKGQTLGTKLLTISLLVEQRK